MHPGILTSAQKSALSASALTLGSNGSRGTRGSAHRALPPALGAQRDDPRGLGGGKPAVGALFALPALPGPRPGRGEKFPGKVRGGRSRSQPPGTTASPRLASLPGRAARARPALPLARSPASPTTEPGEEKQGDEQQQQRRRRRGRQQQSGRGGRRRGKLCFAASRTQRGRARGPRHARLALAHPLARAPAPQALGGGGGGGRGAEGPARVSSTPGSCAVAARRHSAERSRLPRLRSRRRHCRG